MITVETPWISKQILDKLTRAWTGAVPGARSPKNWHCARARLVNNATAIAARFGKEG